MTSSRYAGYAGGSVRKIVRPVADSAMATSCVALVTRNDDKGSPSFVFHVPRVTTKGSPVSQARDRE